MTEIDVPPSDDSGDAAAISERAEALRLENNATMTRLLTQHQVNVDGLSVVNLRLLVLIEQLIGAPGGLDRARFELAVQERLAANLARIQSDVNKQVLTRGVQSAQLPPLPGRNHDGGRG